MSDEPGLLASIVANPDEDTPRLAYADWLDEHDAPIRAEFIRVQCQLVRATAADPNYCDLQERHAELCAQFQPLAPATVPELPDDFTFNDDFATLGIGFRRGFPHKANAWLGDSPGELEHLAKGLESLVANTTMRGLFLQVVTPEKLARLLAVPGFGAITDLRLQVTDRTYPGSSEGRALVRVLAGTKSLNRLERLDLEATVPVRALLDLTPQLEHLRSFCEMTPAGTAEDVSALAQTPWFRNLRHATFQRASAEVHGPLVAALGQLPHLESVTLPWNSDAKYKALATADFPALTSLDCSDAHAAAPHLALGRFPRLAELRLGSNVQPQALRKLLSAKWFPQLRVLNVRMTDLDDGSAQALATSAAAPHLRALHISGQHFTKAGFAAITNGSSFPNLTTLDLGSMLTATRSATFVKLAAGLSLPRVRHLDLGYWRFGDAGAKALADNPHLANLTRLSVDHCGIGEPGFTALVRSPYLQKLIELDVRNNNLTKAGALLDPDRLPKLAALDLDDNPLTDAARKKLYRARGWAE